jgi:folate-binding protein YgfZ
MMAGGRTQDPEILELGRTVREVGFFARLGGEGVGMACPGVIRVSGGDALSFLHSQVTNEVEGLAPGGGNYSARVTLQGQLVELFSVHRVDGAQESELWLILERDRIAALLAEFEAALFTDDVQLVDASGDYRWSTLQGPGSAELLDGIWPDAEAPWSHSKNYSIRAPGGEGTPPGTRVISRSLGGDRGFLIALPMDADESVALEERVRLAAGAANFQLLEEPARSKVLEVLRIEAGVVRIGPDTQGRKRVLPETGLEQYAVSYTKGCYLGQEVIARIRTYGALPFGLRGLVFESTGQGIEAAREAKILERLPQEGEPLILEDGSKVGQIASRTLSPMMDAAVAFAYLDKAHRTPGTELRIRLGDVSIGAKVELLPFYSAPDLADRVAWLYDRAVRHFAASRENVALEMLEEALRLDPSFSDGYEAVGVMLGRSERFHEAIDIFKRLEEIAPNEPMVNTNLSLYFMKIGDKESAEAEAARAMQKEMAQKSGRTVDSEALDRVMAEQQQADARRKKEMFGQVLEIDPDDPIALFGLGNAAAALGEWESAVAAYARATGAETDNSAIYLAHGKALEQIGLGGRAEAVYRAGMEVASRKGDLMPLKEMEHRVLLLASRASGSESDLASE